MTRDIKREKFDGSLAKHQIFQYFSPSINCAIQYVLNISTEPSEIYVIDLTSLLANS